MFPVPSCHGFEPIDRPKEDESKYHTMVYKTAFLSDGEVHGFELFTWPKDRRLRVGVYRSTGDPCGFELIQMKEYDIFYRGYNKVVFQNVPEVVK